MALRGGKLVIRYERESGHLFMTGPAVEVFRALLTYPKKYIMIDKANFIS